MRGWLSKRGPVYGWRWKQRWCVLESGKLEYYADEDCSERKGVIELGPSSRIVPFVSGPNLIGDCCKHARERPFGFVLDVDPSLGPDRHLHYFDAGDARSFEAWCKKIEAMAESMNSSMESSSATLRLIQITDVYMLDCFPSMSNLIKDKSAELAAKRGGKQTGSKTFSCLTGDFLMPYLLSTVDRGKGMMQMLNETPIDILTWGNHENDLPHHDVMEREKEYEGIWINTNMQSHESFANSTCQKDAEIIEVASVDGSNVRKVGLIGILSSSASLYKPGAFGGATIEDPWETMATYKRILEQERGCHLVVPMCHLYEPQDEHTARTLDFPVILSGHDHHVVDKFVAGSRILKPGLDGIKAIILDITWPHGGSCAPVITADTVTVADWKPDPELLRLKDQCYEVLASLRKTQLAMVPKEFRPLSSSGSRNKRVTCGTYLCSTIRDALNMDSPVGKPHCDCCLIKGGTAPRAGKEYTEHEHVTLEFLRAEIQESVIILVTQVPGELLRVGLQETWKVPNPGWFQYDNTVELDSNGFIVAIAGEPLDPKRLYRVGTVPDFFRSSDGPSIGGYFDEDPSRKPDMETGIPVHCLLMEYYAEIVWSRLWCELDNDGKGHICQDKLQVLGQRGDGVVRKEDLRVALQKMLGFDTDAKENALIDKVLTVAGGCTRQSGRLTIGGINRTHLEKLEKKGIRLSSLDEEDEDSDED